ncbi:MAG: hypothetical protein A2033_00945 [Bacteroidetes bacterium GWA2_31_9]|nr:MAG: hypothetical protein A2033_00945 [Bacteroidetes bacterium GWA2_31_9]
MKQKMKTHILTLVFSILALGFSWGQSIEWSKCYGGSNIDKLYTIHLTNDSGYVIGGYSYSNNGDVSVNYGYFDMFVLKIDSLGNKEWATSIGGYTDDILNDIIQTSDSGYIVLGNKYVGPTDIMIFDCHDYCLVKLNKYGNIAWQKVFGGNKDDIPNAIIKVSNNEFIFLGFTNSNDSVFGNHGDSDFHVVKINDDGNIIWQRCYGGSNQDRATAISKINDNSYIISGYSASNDFDVTENKGLLDIWIINIDSVGNIIWQKSFGGSDYDLINSTLLIQDQLMIVGSTRSTDGDISFHYGSSTNSDCWLLKMDLAGNLIWQKVLGGSKNDAGMKIERTNDNKFVIVGYTNSNDGDISGYIGNNPMYDYMIIKVDSNGVVEWEKTLGGSSDEQAVNTSEVINNKFVVAGWTKSNDINVSGNHGLEDFWVVKFIDNITSSNSTFSINNEFKIYPNPASNEVFIELENVTSTSSATRKYKVFGIDGKKVLEGKLETPKTRISTKDLESGIYFIEVNLGNETLINKFVKL